MKGDHMHKANELQYVNVHCLQKQPGTAFGSSRNVEEGCCVMTQITAGNGGNRTIENDEKKKSTDARL